MNSTVCLQCRSKPVMISDTFSAIDAFVKLILVITGSALIICFCHRLTNYKKSRRYKSAGLHHQQHSSSHQHHLISSSSRQQDYYGLPDHHQLAAAAAAAAAAGYDPYNRQQLGLGYAAAANLLGTPATNSIAQQQIHSNNNYPLVDNNSSNNINQYAYLRGPGSAASVAAAATLLRSGAVLPHLITNPVYSPTQPSAIGENHHHPLSEDDVRVQQQQQQQSDCLPDGVILDACPSYEEAVAAAVAAHHQSIVNSNATTNERDGESPPPPTDNRDQQTISSESVEQQRNDPRTNISANHDEVDDEQGRDHNNSIAADDEDTMAEVSEDNPSDLGDDGE